MNHFETLSSLPLDSRKCASVAILGIEAYFINDLIMATVDIRVFIVNKVLQEVLIKSLYL